MMKMFCKGSLTLALLFGSTLAMANCDLLKNLEITTPNTTTICKPDIDVLFGYSTEYKSPVWGVYKMKSSLSAQKPVYLRSTGMHSPIRGISIDDQTSPTQIIKSGQAKAYLVPHYNVLSHASQVSKFLTMANVFPVKKELWSSRLRGMMFELGANERTMALTKGDFDVVSGVVYDDELIDEVPSAKYLYKVYYHSKYDYTLSYLIPVKAKTNVLSSYLTSVRCIEEVSGHTLFSGFAASMKQSIKNGVAFSSKHWASPNHKESSCLLKS
ncbi:MAG: hypothetical protein ACJAXJ_003537 [Colwellia sp.]|jgi:hypothetical protein